MTVTTFTGGLVQTNGYLVTGEEGVVVIDAPAGIWAECQAKGIKPTGLLLTHQHFDHVEDVAVMAQAGVPIYAAVPYSQDLVLDSAARRWGLPVQVPPFEVTHLFADQDALELAGLRFDLHPLPGHSPDSFVFHVVLFQKVFVGDTVFAGSVGRTDLPGGDHDLLLNGIRKELLPLAPDTKLYPGHGPATTVARESAGNPFLA